MNTDKQRNFLIGFAYYAVILLIAVALLKYAMPLLAPFVAAFIIAFLLQRPIRFISRLLHLPQKITALLLVLLVYVAVGLVLSLIGIRVISAVASLIGALPALYSSYLLPSFMGLLSRLEEIFLDLDPTVVAVIEDLGGRFIQTIGTMISNLSVSVMAAVSGFATALPSLFVELVLLLISTFFIAMDYDKLTAFCVRQFTERTKQVVDQIRHYVVGTLLVCIRSYAIIMSVTFVELSICLSLLGIKNSVIIALCISVFDILPVLGTGGIMIPWAVIALIQGDLPLCLSLLLIYVGITIIRNIIEPKIVGSQLGLHPVVTLCSMFAGAQLFGIVGLFGFPIGLSLLRHLNDNGVIRILK